LKLALAIEYVVVLEKLRCTKFTLSKLLSTKTGKSRPRQQLPPATSAAPDIPVKDVIFQQWVQVQISAQNG
jgi:hypothetical protein